MGGPFVYGLARFCSAVLPDADPRATLESIARTGRGALGSGTGAKAGLHGRLRVRLVESPGGASGIARSAFCVFGCLRSAATAGLLPRPGEPVADRVPHRLGPALRADLREDAVHVRLDGRLAENEPFADLPVGQPLADER